MVCKLLSCVGLPSSHQPAGSLPLLPCGGLCAPAGLPPQPALRAPPGLGAAGLPTLRAWATGQEGRTRPDLVVRKMAAPPTEEPGTAAALVGKDQDGGGGWRQRRRGEEAARLDGRGFGCLPTQGPSDSTHSICNSLQSITLLENQPTPIPDNHPTNWTAPPKPA